MRKRRRLTALFLSFRKPITFYALTAAVAAGFRRNHTRVQHDRINDLYDRSRLVAVRPQLHIAAVLDILRGKDARAAFAAEQYHALVKYSQAIDDTRTADHAAHLALDAIEEAYINRIAATVKRLQRLPHSFFLFFRENLTPISITAQQKPPDWAAFLL